MLRIFFQSKDITHTYVPKGVEEIYIINEQWFNPSDCIKAAKLELLKSVDIRPYMEASKSFYNSGIYLYAGEDYIGYFDSADSAAITFIGYGGDDIPEELKELWDKKLSGELYWGDQNS